MILCRGIHVAGGLGPTTEAKFLLQILDAIVVTLVLAVHVYCVYYMTILSECVAGSFWGRR